MTKGLNETVTPETVLSVVVWRLGLLVKNPEIQRNPAYPYFPTGPQVLTWQNLHFGSPSFLRAAELARLVPRYWPFGGAAA